MTSLDIIILLLLGGGGLMGLIRGFVCETLSLVAWVLSIIAIRLFQVPVAEWLGQWVGTSSGAAVLALAITGGGTFFVGKLIARQIGARTRASALGPVDRVLGFGFGAVKGLIIATLAYLVFSLGYDTLYGGGAIRPEWLVRSRTFPLINATGSAVSEFIDQRRREGRPKMDSDSVETEASAN